MKRVIKFSFYAVVIAGNVFSYRGSMRWSIVSALVPFALWVTFYLLYARRVPVSPPPRESEFEPVAFTVGLFFLAFGVWSAVKFLPGTPTVIGALLFGLIFVLLPICYGVFIIRNHLRLRRPKGI